MKLRTAILPIALAGAALPLAAARAQDITAGITETKTESAVSISADPDLSDGQLVLRIAVQNRTRKPMPFGPASIRVTMADGTQVALRPLASLIDDVRSAAGMAREDGSDVSVPVQEAPVMTVTGTGQKDVSGYTGSMGATAPVSQPRRDSKRKRIDFKQAEAQIAALKAGILTDTVIAPGDIAAGQVVSERLKFRNKRARGLTVVLSAGGDEYSFAFDAPKD